MRCLLLGVWIRWLVVSFNYFFENHKKGNFFGETFAMRKNPIGESKQIVVATPANLMQRIKALDRLYFDGLQWQSAIAGALRTENCELLLLFFKKQLIIIHAGNIVVAFSNTIAAAMHINMEVFIQLNYTS